MAKEILVSSILNNEMVETGRDVVEQIAGSSLEVVGAFWLYFDEAEEWRLVLVSKRLRKDGPLALYTEFNKLIFDKGKNSGLGFNILNTTFLDANDKLVRALANIPGGQAHLHEKQLPGFLSQGVYVPDTYVYFVSDEIVPHNGKHSASR